ncbi:hypothetical protein L195_g017120, partial [Trifolium pratense]
VADAVVIVVVAIAVFAMRIATVTA